MANDVSTRYTQREKRERRKDRYLGTAVGGSAVGLQVAGNNASKGSLERMRRGARSTNVTLNGRRLPRTSRALGAMRATKGVSLKGLAGAGLLGLTAAGGRYALRDREPKQFVAKADAWKELKSQTVYGMPSHQTSRLGARGRSEAMARSIPDPALPFVAPKGERMRAANAQTKATLSGAALGTAAGAAAGALVGGPKAWKASARGAKATLAQLKRMRSASRQPALPGMKPSAKDVAQAARKKAAARFTPQRRADLARGAVGGAVTGAAVNINSANAAKETVEANPKAWERNDRKIRSFVNKSEGEAMPTLAQIAKAQRQFAESDKARAAYGIGGAAGILGGAAGLDYGLGARSAARANRSASQLNAQARNAYMSSARRNVRDSARIMEQGRQAFGSGSFSSDKARGMKETVSEARRHRGYAQRNYGRGRELGRAAARQRVRAMGQAKRGKLALIAGPAAMAGGIGLAAYGGRPKPTKKKVSKAIEPDVDPTGFLDYVRREHEPLRDSAGRFAGKAVDDVGPAIVATPYPEEE